MVVSSYLPAKAKFHVSSKMRQAGDCDTPRKIERVRVVRTACMGDGCVLTEKRDKMQPTMLAKRKVLMSRKNITLYNDIHE